MCSLDITTVRPDAKRPFEVEYAIKASAMPIHVKLDQRVLKLFLDVFSDDSDDSHRIVSPPYEENMMYFQKVEIDRLSLRLDYCGRQVDVDALRSGNLLEALNLVPWDGVLLDIRPLRLTGIAGAAPVVQTALHGWLEDITRTQAHKFVQSVKPIKSATNIGRRAAGLVSTPLEFHRNKKRGGAVAGFALSVASFVKEVSLSSIELGAFAASRSAALLTAAEGLMADAEREIEDVASPANVLEGLSLASKAAWRGAGRAARAVVVEPIREYASGDAASSTALLGAVRKVPYAAVAGAKGVTEAVDHALSGAIASFRPPSRDVADGA
jgi:autophagy-related protein 2